MSKIIYTLTDEAPLLATGSLLPILRAFTKPGGIEIEVKDISLAGRILATFSDYLPADQQFPDDLSELGKLVNQDGSNIIKLPNISASLPQLKAAIKELQSQGFPLPDYPDQVDSPAQAEIRNRYDQVKGSAVNPVLRQGNSDRRAPRAVKQYAKTHPHQMGKWSTASKTTVATMSAGDFASNEQSVTITKADTLQVTLHPADPSQTAQILLEKLPVTPGEIVDGTFMSAAALDQFLAEQVTFAKQQDLLFSAHLKATMMKVSDPIIFGHVLKAYFAEVFTRYQEDLDTLGLRAEDGLGTILAGLSNQDEENAAAPSKLSKGSATTCAAAPYTVTTERKAQIKAAFTAALQDGAKLAMVDSEKGITCLHVPSDVIVDASMPAMIRNSGQMWGADGKPHDTLAVIPDSSYAGIYQAVIDDCREHGALDPATMGTVPNVGLMAQKAEEYGSHDKTFLIPFPGRLEVTNQAGEVLLSHQVQTGDIWRGCQTKDAPVKDWIKLAVSRARLSETPAIFWLDSSRAHDAQLLKKINTYLPTLDTSGLEIQILPPAQAAKVSIQRARAGKDTISVTGNVLRDYNTDLFPILELGTSAKMLSVVPLMAGGCLFETGAGGSAPKHVEQVLKENHLRWDSLGEFLAIAESLRYLGRKENHLAAAVLAETLDQATELVLENQKSPARKVQQPDNRTSHAYLATYWAQALAEQTKDLHLAQLFRPVAAALTQKIDLITTQLLAVQGQAGDLGGYYRPEKEKLQQLMCPSPIFNQIIAQLKTS